MNVCVSYVPLIVRIMGRHRGGHGILHRDSNYGPIQVVSVIHVMSLIVLPAVLMAAHAVAAIDSDSW